MQKFKQGLEQYGPLLARILLAQVFIISGTGKIKAFFATSVFMGNMGIPLPQLMLVLTIALEIGGGLLLVVGWQARWAALAFFGFTFLTAVLFHPFWSVEPQALGGQLNNFMKNLSIMGGMLYIAIHGPGALSISRNDFGWNNAATPSKK
jgi:putative oxidoreductase